MTGSPSIPSVLKSEAGRAFLAGLPPPARFPGRMAVAQAVCEGLGLVDTRGRLRTSSCIAALAALEAEGAFRLPPGGPGRGVPRAPRLQAAPVAAPVGLPSRADGVRGLEVRPVDGGAERRLLSRMLADEHPPGAAQHAGRQMRHLIGSGHGWLGGLLFASPAPRLSARDAWIGWDASARAAGLGRVVGMSRFLVRTGLSCRNLAPKALAPVLRRLGDDFLERCGVRPLLAETFVGPGCAGGSLRPPPRPRAVLGPGDGLDRDRRAVNESGGAALHGRLRDRLVASAAVQAAAASKTSFTAACGNRALVTGHCRMIGKADHEHAGLTPEGVLAGHRERTARCRSSRTARTSTSRRITAARDQG